MCKKEDDGLIRLADVETGSIVKFSTTGVTYIHCGTAYGNVQIIRDLVVSSISKKTALDYDGSAADTYITGTLYPSYSELAKSKMKESTITIYVSDGSTRTTKNIARKIYCPTSGQIGNSGAITAALKKYKGTSTSNTARIAKDSGGTARGYWTCDVYSSNAAQSGYISATGAVGGAVPSTAEYIRPVVSLDPDTKVMLIDGAYIVQEG